MTANRFTPATIGSLSFSIPLYQRLFEWEEKQINQLMTDLWLSFQTDATRPYYIGMLTSFSKEQTHSLVDGQQRFTVLTLMAIAFDTESWRQFLMVGSQPRLCFFGRKQDQDYLKRKIENPTIDADYANPKMTEGIRLIRTFWESKQSDVKFPGYIYEHATFFLSVLPASYDYQDLNRHFESMNATGKGLENHEILKVRLLKKLGVNTDKRLYTRVWNSVSQMDHCLLQPKSDERGDEFRRRYLSVLQGQPSIQSMFALCNRQTGEAESVTIRSIRQIEPSSKSPEKTTDTRSERAILGFPEFLLQVLWLGLAPERRESRTDFFNTQKLLDTFEYFKEVNTEAFFLDMLRFRIIFDYSILRINHSDQSGINYSLHFSEDSEVEMAAQVLNYQAMLYVSTVSYNWLTNILKYLESNPDVGIGEFLGELKRQDDERCRNRNIGFTYGTIDRYWFWRLDYYLWLRRDQYFSDRSLEIAKKYVFKANRSIEHVAPQTPKSDSTISVPYNDMNDFGNLAMISSGQNSSLQNETFEIKRAHVASYLSGDKSGSIESLKLLKIYDYPMWNSETIREHREQMLLLLADTFKGAFADIGEKLTSRSAEKIAEPTIA